MTQPAKDPFLPENQQPVMVCRTCQHFDRKKRADGSEDTLNGGCKMMGYSNTPHNHTCALWAKRRKTRKEDEE
jgi:hypothetical protein